MFTKTERDLIKQYIFVYTFARNTGSPSKWALQEVKEAHILSAPYDAIYFNDRECRWHTISDVTASTSRRLLLQNAIHYAETVIGQERNDD